MHASQILLPVAFLTWSFAEAQIGKRILNRAKSDVEYKVNQKINQKVDKGVDKAVDEVDTVLTGKKARTEPKKTKEARTSVTTDNPSTGNPNESTDKFAARMNSEFSNTTVFTNINCEQGKRLVEKRLKGLKGVKSCMVNIQNGDLQVSYDQNGISYKSIITELNNLGFEADSHPPVAGKKGCN